MTWSTQISLFKIIIHKEDTNIKLTEDVIEKEQKIFKNVKASGGDNWGERELIDRN